MAEVNNTTTIGRKGKEDHEKYFNPTVYLNQYYKTPQGNPEEPGFLQFVVDTAQSLHNSEYQDPTSRPSNIHSLIPAANFFKKIVLTDLAERNRAEVERWVKKEPDAHEWTPFFRFHAEKDGFTDWAEKQEEFRKKVEKVIPCNVLHMNPLYPEHMDPVDAVTSCLCLETAGDNLSQYRQIMKNVSSLIKTGGHFILIGVLNETYYNVGEEKFYCLSLTADDIKSAMADAALGDIVWYDQAHKSDDTVSDYAGAFIAVAVKKAI